MSFSLLLERGLGGPAYAF